MVRLLEERVVGWASESKGARRLGKRTEKTGSVGVGERELYGVVGLSVCPVAWDFAVNVMLTQLVGWCGCVFVVRATP